MVSSSPATVRARRPPAKQPPEPGLDRRRRGARRPPAGGRTVASVAIDLLVPPAHAALARRHGARQLRGAWSHPGPLPSALRRFAPTLFSPEAFALQVQGATLPPSSGHEPTLRAHQGEAVDAIAAAHRAGLPGFLLADEVGLGKTFSVIFAVREMASASRRPLRVLVLAPLSVVPHWQRSLRDAGPGSSLWCVTNYEQVRSLLFAPTSAQRAKRTRTRNKRHASQGRSRTTWDVVILDESHRLKNPSAQRSRAVRQLVETNRQGKRRQPAFTIWLSATAGQNPLELSYLAPLLASRHGVSSAATNDFARWCAEQGLAVTRGRFGAWEYAPGPGDVDKVRALLFDPFRPRRAPVRTRVVGGLRRRPTEIAGWPELVRALTPVELTAPQRRLYELAWEEFRRELELAASGRDAVNPMVAALRFRQKASLLRVPGTAQVVRDALEDGLRPAVSVQFRETTDALTELLAPTLRVGRIDGSVPPSEREAMRGAFQRGELDVMLFSVVEGISLHAGEIASSADHVPRVLLLHDLRWSALEMAQIEGRTHRDGQSALARYLYATESVEEHMVQAVVTKLTTMASMLGDDLTALEALLAAGTANPR